MADREKTIKGLEECAGNGNCTKCQYGKEKQALSCQKLLSDALELLKEQEAKLPRKITKIGGLMNGICPNPLCNAEINNISNGMACGYCGQAVKWE